MKALIFNSGLGSRLGELTKDKPKALVRLGDAETIFARQLRLLFECGIRDFVVTTGPFAEKLKSEVPPFISDSCSISFVSNPDYRETNYIYSMHLADRLVRGCECLILHGDLVFDKEYVQRLIQAPEGSYGSVNAAAPLPEKDFKARISKNQIIEVSVSIIDKDCVAFQPFYRLSSAAMDVWLDAVADFVSRGITSVYAENAAKAVFSQMNVQPFSYETHYVEEVDTPDDRSRVERAIIAFDYRQQAVYSHSGSGLELIEGCGFTEKLPTTFASLFSDKGMKRPLVVCSSRYDSAEIARYLDVTIDVVSFSRYSSNPTYEQLVEGIELFRREQCDSLISIGGGSAIDVAKCIKAFVNSGEPCNTRELPKIAINPPRIPHLAIPTTAGTGSESTHFAVIYFEGEKQSIASPCLQPETAVLDADYLTTLPAYQKKSALLDALCQAIESHWSVSSTPESRSYSAKAMKLIVSNIRAYLVGDSSSSREILRASNYAGKAINLSKTTAAHAMSYKLTSLFGIPHGHAVALCMPYVWIALLEHCSSNKKGEANPGGDLSIRIDEINNLLSGGDSKGLDSGLVIFEGIYKSMQLPEKWRLECSSDVDGTLDILTESVNMSRLNNFPINLPKERIRAIYQLILAGSAKESGVILGLS